jgi:hypothetical protein
MRQSSGNPARGGGRFPLRLVGPALPRRDASESGMPAFGLARPPAGAGAAPADAAPPSSLLLASAGALVASGAGFGLVVLRHERLLCTRPQSSAVENGEPGLRVPSRRNFSAQAGGFRQPAPDPPVRDVHAGPPHPPAKGRKCPVSPRADLLDRSAETWPSGRRRSPAKGVDGEPSRGFESHRLRHFYDISYLNNEINFFSFPILVPLCVARLPQIMQERPALQNEYLLLNLVARW